MTREFSLRRNGQQMTTFRVEHHLSAYDIAAILAEHAYATASIDGVAVEKLFPFTIGAIEKIVRDELIANGPESDRAADIPERTWDSIFVLAQKNVADAYNLTL